MAESAVKVTIPTVVATALVTALVNLGVQSCGPTDRAELGALRRDVAGVMTAVGELRAEQRALLDRINWAEDSARNTALVEALSERQGQRGAGP